MEYHKKRLETSTVSVGGLVVIKKMGTKQLLRLNFSSIKGVRKESLVEIDNKNKI